jgi:DNA-binding transcriptional LysR family regulator
MDVVLQSLGYARNIKMRIQNYQVAASIVEQTDLLWTVPKILIGDTNLIFQELPYTIEPLAWNLYWHKSALEDPANIWMREMIEEIIRGLL